MRRIFVPLFLALALSSVIAPSALATRAEERQGAVLLREFRAGNESCASLSSTQFELVGEYLMARMIGSPAAHDAMNARIKQMMGAEAEAQAHVFLAQRNMGCSQGAVPPASFGQMMGVVGSSRHGGGGVMNAGMSGGGGGVNSGAMGGSGSRESSIGNHHSGGSSSPTVWVVLLGGAFLAALVVGLVMLMRRRSPIGTAAEILDQRFANGEIVADEYERRRRALGSADGPGPPFT
jgi:hypothetical protein